MLSLGVSFKPRAPDANVIYGAPDSNGSCFYLVFVHVYIRPRRFYQFISVCPVMMMVKSNKPTLILPKHIVFFKENKRQILGRLRLHQPKMVKSVA